MSKNLLSCGSSLGSLEDVSPQHKSCNKCINLFVCFRVRSYHELHGLINIRKIRVPSCSKDNIYRKIRNSNITYNNLNTLSYKKFILLYLILRLLHSTLMFTLLRYALMALCFDVNVNFTLLGYAFFISKFSETDVYRCSTKYF